MIRNAWHISGGEGQAANTANRRVLVTHSDGSQSVVEIDDDLGIKSDNKNVMMKRLRQQGVDVAQISLFDGAGDTNASAQSVVRAKNKTFAHSNVLSQDIEHITNTSVGGGKRVTGRSKASSGISWNQSSITFGNDNLPEPPSPSTGRRVNPNKTLSKTLASSLSPGLKPLDADKVIPPPPPKHSLAHTSGSKQRSVRITRIIKDLKEQLKERGARGIVGLSRKFKIMDDDGNGALSPVEFKKAMRECALDLSEDDCHALFVHFDTDCSGDIDFEEFLQGLRGDLSARRKNLINMAFDVVDKDGNGVLEPDDLIDVYDASKHPDVLSGKKTPDEVLREFLDTFDVGGEVDGKVTRQEFMNYYHNLSASIDNEDYFELMIRNAWHISGGEGQAANTANRRVLVTGNDGRQYVEEIQHDLGLKADDKGGAVARLRAQGDSNVSSISFFGGVDQVDKNPVGGAVPKRLLVKPQRANKSLTSQIQFG